MHSKTAIFLTVFICLFCVAGVFAQGNDSGDSVTASAPALEGKLKVGPAIILIVILLTFISVGLLNRAKDTSTYWAAARGISPVGSGMAIASNWMSAASFLGMAAIMYGSGYHGLAYVVGWTGGYVLLLVLMAGQIRRYGKYTAADFIGDRYYSKGLHGFAAVIAICISISYCVGQFAGIGLVFKWILGIDYKYAVIIGSSVVLFYTLISGMLGVTKNMQIQYVIIIISFMIPLFIITFKYDYFSALPQVGFGEAVSHTVDGLEPTGETNMMGHEYGILPSPEYAMPWDPATNQSAFKWMAICFSLMIGTAGLPHVIQRFYVVPKARDARWSVVWGLFFISLLYWSAPVYSVFGKILSADPEVGVLTKDNIVIYTSQLAAVFPLVTAFLAAGAVSAAFSTVSGLLVAGASAFSNDLYYRVINPKATDKQQMVMARVGTVMMAIIVTLIALMKLGLIAQLVAVAFSMAGCTIFPLFLLGVWWSGSNRSGAWAGLAVGSLVSLVAIGYFIASKQEWDWPAASFMAEYLNPWYFAWFGAPLAIATNIIVSLFTKETPQEIKNFLAEKVHGY